MLTAETTSPPERSVGTAGFSADELSLFQRDGYLIARGLCPLELRQQMWEATSYGLAHHTPPVEYEADLHYPGAPASREGTGGDTIRRLKEAHGRHPAFVHWVSSRDLVTRLQQIFQQRVVMPLAHHNCIMTKQPQFSSATGWHQDIRYWSFTRPDLVNVWMALGDETEENARLHLIPGTHNMTFARHRFDDALFLRPDHPENTDLIAQQVLAELSPGDVLFFHARTFHAAGRNQTTTPKFSVVFTFRPADNLPRPGTRSSSQPELLLPDAPM